MCEYWYIERGLFTWTDNEVDLLLQVTNEYEVIQREKHWLEVGSPEM